MPIRKSRKLSFLLQLINIIRLCNNTRWFPTKIGLRSDFGVAGCVYRAEPNAHFLPGQDNAFFEVPLELLCSPSLQYPVVDIHDVDCYAVEDKSWAPADLACYVRGLMRSYLSDGDESIGHLSEIMCISVRTLQRILATAGLEYRNLLQETRYEVASELLRSTDKKIIEISEQMGYTDPSHFSRAFRRSSGISPRHFRSAHNSAQVEVA